MPKKTLPYFELLQAVINNKAGQITVNKQIKICGGLRGETENHNLNMAK